MKGYRRIHGFADTSPPSHPGFEQHHKEKPKQESHGEMYKTKLLEIVTVTLRSLSIKGPKFPSKVSRSDFKRLMLGKLSKEMLATYGEVLGIERSEMPKLKAPLVDMIEEKCWIYQEAEIV